MPDQAPTLSLADVSAFVIPCVWLPDVGTGVENRYLTIEQSGVDADGDYWSAKLHRLRWSRDVAYLTVTGWHGGPPWGLLFRTAQEALDAAWATDEIGPR
jgi:hypothetical protein